MKRRSFLAALAPIVLAAPAIAQTQVAPPPAAPAAPKPKASSGTAGAAGNPAGAATATGAAAAAPADNKPKRAKGPTEITAQEAMLDNKANLAVFSGVVDVKAPDYTVNCDKLTVYLKKSQPKAADAKAPEPRPIGEDPADAADANKAKDKGKADDNNDSDGGAIDTAIAEGNVKIVQIKPAQGNNPPEKYYGVGKKAVFDNAKQTCTLTGWPRVQQFVGGKLTREIVPLEEGCVIVMNNDRIDVRGGRQQTRILDEDSLGGNEANGKKGANGNGSTTPGATPAPAGAKSGATAAPAVPGAAAEPAPFRTTPTGGGLELGPR